MINYDFFPRFPVSCSLTYMINDFLLLHLAYSVFSIFKYVLIHNCRYISRVSWCHVSYLLYSNTFSCSSFFVRYLPRLDPHTAFSQHLPPRILRMNSHPHLFPPWTQNTILPPFVHGLWIGGLVSYVVYTSPIAVKNLIFIFITS